MLKKFFLLIFGICIFQISICQKKGPSHLQSVSDNLNYFKLLFGTDGSINLDYAVLKIEIKNQPYVLITTKGEFKNYFKEKYSVSDSVAESKEHIFLMKNDKISFSDTAFLHNNPQLGRINIYHDSIFNKYRRVNLIDFLNTYCPIPQLEENIFVLAFLFEKRLLYDWNNHSISHESMSLLAERYSIEWDNIKHVWQKRNVVKKFKISKR